MPTRGVVAEHKTFIEGDHFHRTATPSDDPELAQLERYLNTKYFNSLSLNTVQQVEIHYRKNSIPPHRVGATYLIIWEAG